MEVDDAAAYNTSSTKTVLVKTPAVAVATTKVQPPRSSDVVVVNKKRQKIHNKSKPTITSKIKTTVKATPATTLVVAEDFVEENNSLRLVVSSDDELENIHDIQIPKVQQQKATKSLINNNNNSNSNNNSKIAESSSLLKVELNSDEEKTVKFCAKRKRYEVSNLGSQEIFLGCDEASGETCLISESAAEPEEVATLQQQITQQEQINNNNNNSSKNMADRKTSSRQNNKKLSNIETKQGEKQDDVIFVKNIEPQNELENSAPAAKRMKKNSPAHAAVVDLVTKTSPHKKVVDAPPAIKQQPQTHIVADGDERSVSQTSSVAANTKTRSTANGQKQPIVAATNSPGNKPMAAQDDFYKKPFEYGWKRELVWRATPESGRERADVYFISPAGKKIRTRHDIPPLLQGDLKMEHFCWLREPVGVGPEHETVRNAKPNPNRSTAYAAVALAASAAVNTPVTGKRMPKPKVPKGASPPPEGWTPARALKVNNAALNSRSGGMGSSTPHNRTSGTSTRGSGGGGSNKKKITATAATKSTSSATTSTTTNQAINVVNINNNNNSSNNANPKNISGIKGVSGVGYGNVNNNMSVENSSKLTSSTRRTTNARKIITSDDDLNYQNILNRNICEPCTIMCPRAPGLIPQLQCVKCLCLYHHQCVGLSPNSSLYRRAGEGHNGRDYICESCSPKAKNEATTKNNTSSSSSSTTLSTAVVSTTKSGVATSTPKSTLASRSKPTTSSVNKSQRATSTTPTATSAGRSTTSAGNKRSTSGAGGSGSSAVSNNKYPQTIAVVKGKKYVVVEKPRTKTKHNEYVNDIENDLKQINESIRNNLPTQPSLTKLEAAYQLQQQQNALVTVSSANQFYGKNFFANMSYAFDSLLIILKYLKIHERMRFGSVCKLWYAAANSRSVWQTVRMKNSKVCDWAGCAAALQRNGTKHLDLRKMLFSSVRADEMWADFSTHIGNACFLENIDLCRCPARVVEALFKSNKNLRILNAMTVNDDALNLEHISNLSNLVELRLRTNEAAVLTHDLYPLGSLTKLTHFSLTSISSLGSKGIEALKNLKALRSLELGECGGFDETFANVVLPQLTQLQRLRLENGQDTGCCTLAIMKSASKLKHLKQLELVNFDVRPSFEELLQQFKVLSKLLIIPTYLSQSATTNQTVLDAVQKIAPQLKVFTWGVTVELLRVTALYVDQCEESSKKEKHNFNECIPVLKPVPGAAAVDDHDMDADNSGSGATLSTAGDNESAANDVPQIEILPLDKVERILAANMPNTKFQIVKVPYHATCKQQLNDNK